VRGCGYSAAVVVVCGGADVVVAGGWEVVVVAGRVVVGPGLRVVVVSLRVVGVAGAVGGGAVTSIRADVVVVVARVVGGRDEVGGSRFASGRGGESPDNTTMPITTTTAMRVRAANSRRRSIEPTLRMTLPRGAAGTRYHRVPNAG
jgi:cation transporter-like permease